MAYTRQQAEIEMHRLRLREAEEQKRTYALQFTNTEVTKNRFISEAPRSPIRCRVSNPYSFITPMMPPEVPIPPDPPDFPKFDGTGVRDWINRCEQFFYLHNTPPEQKSRLAFMHMAGEALQWHNDFIRNHYGLLPPWSDCIIALFTRFDVLYDDSLPDLVSSKQIVTTAEYVDKSPTTSLSALNGSTSSYYTRDSTYEQLICDKEEKNPRYVEADVKKGKSSFLEDDKIILALAMEIDVGGKADGITTFNGVEMENHLNESTKVLVVEGVVDGDNMSLIPAGEICNDKEVDELAVKGIIDDDKVSVQQADSILWKETIPSSASLRRVPATQSQDANAAQQEELVNDVEIVPEVDSILAADCVYPQEMLLQFQLAKHWRFKFKLKSETHKSTEDINFNSIDEEELVDFKESRKSQLADEFLLNFVLYLSPRLLHDKGKSAFVELTVTRDSLVDFEQNKTMLLKTHYNQADMKFHKKHKWRFKKPQIVSDKDECLNGSSSCGSSSETFEKLTKSWRFKFKMGCRIWFPWKSKEDSHICDSKHKRNKDDGIHQAAMMWETNGFEVQVLSCLQELGVGLKLESFSWLSYDSEDPTSFIGLQYKVFWPQYNDLEQFSPKLQSSSCLDYFISLIILRNHALYCGCEADHIRSGTFYVGDVLEFCVYKVFHLQRPPELHRAKGSDRESYQAFSLSSLRTRMFSTREYCNRVNRSIIINILIPGLVTFTYVFWFDGSV